MHARIDFPDPAGPRLQAHFETPLQVWRADSPDQVATVLQAAEQAALAGCWVIGFVSYEAAPAFDSALVVKSGSPLPLACFAAYAGPSPPPVAPQASKVARPEFSCKFWHSSLGPVPAAAQIDAIRQGIASGDFYQINLTMQARSEFSGAPEAFFAALSASQPGAFAAYIDWGAGQILSVSPELFFSRRGTRLNTRPMKGTAARHADPIADRAAADALRNSDKERAENLMIVDLLRNDLARLARTGSVQVDQLFAVEAWPTVWQMTSSISADLRPAVALPEIFAALFPCGSVTGAPKIAAMAEIARLEAEPRGVYCGAIGVIRPGGDADFSVAIRTVSIVPGASTAMASCGLGSAITIDSTASDEYAEWIAKRRFLLRASANFDLLETLRLEDGVFVRLDRHLARLLKSAAWFGFAADEAAIRQALAVLATPATGRGETVAGADQNPGQLQGSGQSTAQGAWRVRLLVGRDGAVRCEAFPLETSPAELRVRLADRPMDGVPEFLCHKTTERGAYEAFADLPSGVFDTLLFNASGELTEFTRGNVFIESAGELLTPPESAGLLPGVLRAELLASGRAREARLSRDLLNGGRLWFGNSLRGLIPARLV